MSFKTFTSIIFIHEIWQNIKLIYQSTSMESQITELYSREGLTKDR